MALFQALRLAIAASLSEVGRFGTDKYIWVEEKRMVRGWCSNVECQLVMIAPTSLFLSKALRLVCSSLPYLSCKQSCCNVVWATVQALLSSTLFSDLTHLECLLRPP